METVEKETQGKVVSAENPGITASADWQPVIIGILCNWCSYAGSDLTGTSRIQYPPNIRIIRVPCSSRVDPWFIIKSLQTRADGVLISGCHPGDCHYIAGNYYARRRFLVTKKLLNFVGYHENRVQFSWVSAAEGPKFAKVVAKVTEDIKKLGPLHRYKKENF
jgi:F420-non-reducing hydrogenase iron-sulfur subunit